MLLTSSLALAMLILCGLGGALALTFAGRKGTRPSGGGLPTVVGGLAGAAGSQLFVGLLNYCMFEAERDMLDQGFGVLLMIIGAGLLIGVAVAVLTLIRNRRTVSGIGAGQFGGSTLTLGRAEIRLPAWGIALLLLAPTLIILALFLYYPALDTFRLATLLARFGAPRTAFVCVDNFTDLARNSDYLRVVLQTFVLAFGIVFLSMSLSLLIATMVYLPIRGAVIYRTLLIWPYSISPVVAGLIFLLLFNPAGGLINQLLGSTLGVRIGWLNDPYAAPWAVIIASVWKSIGFNILFYIAGLQNVPKDLIEAASIDGANAFQRFSRVVIPLLSPITFFLIITNMTYAFFESFGTIDALTNGGPLNATTTMMYQIYEVGVQNGDLGKGAAQSILLFVMVIGLTVLQFRTSARAVNYA